MLKLLTSYRRIAGPHLGQELDTTVADMRTGNYENALLHFQNRVGSTMLSDIVRGLIGTLRGDDQQMYSTASRIRSAPDSPTVSTSRTLTASPLAGTRCLRKHC